MTCMDRVTQNRFQTTRRDITHLSVTQSFSTWLRVLSVVVVVWCGTAPSPVSQCPIRTWRRARRCSRWTTSPSTATWWRMETHTVCWREVQRMFLHITFHENKNLIKIWLLAHVVVGNCIDQKVAALFCYVCTVQCWRGMFAVCEMQSQVCVSSV